MALHLLPTLVPPPFIGHDEREARPRPSPPCAVPPLSVRLKSHPTRPLVKADLQILAAWQGNTDVSNMHIVAQPVTLHPGILGWGGPLQPKHEASFALISKGCRRLSSDGCQLTCRNGRHLALVHRKRTEELA